MFKRLVYSLPPLLVLTAATRAAHAALVDFPQVFHFSNCGSSGVWISTVNLWIAVPVFGSLAAFAFRIHRHFVAHDRHLTASVCATLVLSIGYLAAFKLSTDHVREYDPEPASTLEVMF